MGSPETKRRGGDPNTEKRTEGGRGGPHTAGPTEWKGQAEPHRRKPVGGRHTPRRKGGPKTDRRKGAAGGGTKGTEGRAEEGSSTPGQDDGKKRPLPNRFCAGPRTLAAPQATEAGPRGRWGPVPLPSPLPALPRSQRPASNMPARLPSPTPYPHPGSPRSVTAGRAPAPRHPPGSVQLPKAPRLERLLFLSPFPPHSLLTQLFPPASAPPFVPAALRRTARHTPPPPPSTLRPRLARWARDRARGEDGTCAGASREGRGEVVQNSPDRKGKWVGSRREVICIPRSAPFAEGKQLGKADSGSFCVYYAERGTERYAHKYIYMGSPTPSKPKTPWNKGGQGQGVICKLIDLHESSAFSNPRIGMR